MRQLLVYDRLGEKACVGALNVVHEDWNLLQNLFSPTMKLKENGAKAANITKPTTEHKHPPNTC